MTGRWGRHDWLLVLLLLGVAGALQITLALRPGLWVDEVFSLALATGHSLEHPAHEADSALGDYMEPRGAQPASAFRRYLQHETPPAGPQRVIRAVLLSDTNPPLYYLLLNGWTRAVGTSDAALRLFSVVWALASLPLLWLLGRALGGPRTAWAAGFLFGLAPPALYYSAEGRMYSLLWFLGLALAWLTVGLRRRGGRPGLAVLWIVTGALGLLTHYFFAFVWMACIAWLGLYPGRMTRGALLAATALTCLLVLPWYVRVPESLGRWRVTGDWLATPLSWEQAVAAPVLLAWSLLSGRGVWGGSVWADRLAAGVYALLALQVLRRGLAPLLTRRARLPEGWVLAAVLGPVLFDLWRHTNASLVARYALAGLPGAMMLVGLAMKRLRGWTYPAFLVASLVLWLPAIRDVFAEPSRPFEPFPELAARVESSAGPSNLIIVHSIPSGVLGVARYLESGTPLVSWVPRLGLRGVPADLDALLDGRCGVTLVKVHDLGDPSPAEAWLRRHATLAGDERITAFTEILEFRPDSSAGRSATRCPAWRRSAASARETREPPGPRTAG